MLLDNAIPLVNKVISSILSDSKNRLKRCISLNGPCALMTASIPFPLINSRRVQAITRVPSISFLLMPVANAARAMAAALAAI